MPGRNAETRGATIQPDEQIKKDNPLFPWRVDGETGKVFPVVDLNMRRFTGDLGPREEGVALAMTSIVPGNRSIVYPELADALPDVFIDVIRDLNDPTTINTYISQSRSAAFRAAFKIRNVERFPQQRLIPYTLRLLAYLRSQLAFASLSNDEIAQIVERKMSDELRKKLTASGVVFDSQKDGAEMQEGTDNS